MGTPEADIPVNILLTAPDEDSAVRLALEALKGQGFVEAALDQIGVILEEPDDPTFESAYEDALAGEGRGDRLPRVRESPAGPAGGDSRRNRRRGLKKRKRRARSRVRRDAETTAGPCGSGACPIEASELLQMMRRTAVPLSVYVARRVFAARNSASRSRPRGLAESFASHLTGAGGDCRFRASRRQAVSTCWIRCVTRRT